jgi:hypothetical protein
MPHALTKEEIKALVQEYATAAKNAIAVGARDEICVKTLGSPTLMSLLLMEYRLGTSCWRLPAVSVGQSTHRADSEILTVHVVYVATTLRGQVFLGSLSQSR